MCDEQIANPNQNRDLLLQEEFGKDGFGGKIQFDNNKNDGKYERDGERDYDEWVRPRVVAVVVKGQERKKGPDLAGE